jgi:hypothetical protein
MITEPIPRTMQDAAKVLASFKAGDSRGKIVLTVLS